LAANRAETSGSLAFYGLRQESPGNFQARKRNRRVASRRVKPPLANKNVAVFVGIFFRLGGKICLAREPSHHGEKPNASLFSRHSVAFRLIPKPSSSPPTLCMNANLLH